jgi:hypothetical protein
MLQSPTRSRWVQRDCIAQINIPTCMRNLYHILQNPVVCCRCRIPFSSSKMLLAFQKLATSAVLLVLLGNHNQVVAIRGQVTIGDLTFSSDATNATKLCFQASKYWPVQDCTVAVDPSVCQGGVWPPLRHQPSRPVCTPQHRVKHDCTPCTAQQWPHPCNDWSSIVAMRGERRCTVFLIVPQLLRARTYLLLAPHPTLQIRRSQIQTPFPILV